MFGYWHLFRILLLNIWKLSVFCRTASETSVVPQASHVFPVSVQDNKRLPCEVGTRDDLRVHVSCLDARNAVKDELKNSGMA